MKKEIISVTYAAIEVLYPLYSVKDKLKEIIRGKLFHLWQPPSLMLNYCPKAAQIPQFNGVLSRAFYWERTKTS